MCRPMKNDEVTPLTMSDIWLGLDAEEQWSIKLKNDFNKPLQNR